MEFENKKLCTHINDNIWSCFNIFSNKLFPYQVLTYYCPLQASTNLQDFVIDRKLRMQEKIDRRF